MSSTSPARRHAARRGFTLVELLIVLFIIGLGGMTLTPKIVERAVGLPPMEEFMNDLLTDAAAESLETGRPVIITGFPGSSNFLLTSGERVSLPGSAVVSRAVVNNQPQTGLEYSITVYPPGISDHFELILADGRTIESVPLLLNAGVRQ